MEFSANTFLNVYQGHIDTLNHVRDQCNSAFHVMMHDIFDKAQWVFRWVWPLSLLIVSFRSTTEDVSVAHVSIANIDLEEIDA
jgi:hypothetical protein